MNATTIHNGPKRTLRSAADAPRGVHDGDIESRVSRTDEANAIIETHLEEARQNARAILQVVESMEHADSPDAAMLAALNSVREAFGWAYGTFWALDEGQQVLHFTIESGSIAEEFRRMTMAARFPEGDSSLPGRAWKVRDVIFVRDFGEERTFPRAEVARTAWHPLGDHASRSLLAAS